jgi:predicted transposase/invertase (TIGR01784 family)
MKLSRDEEERAWLLSEYKYAVDTQSKVVQARRDGREEGREEEKLNIAENLKAAGMPIGQIARITGLSEAQVKKLYQPPPKP